MELTGRVTGNANVTTLKDERRVVNFTLAINDYYKPKGATEVQQVTQYVRCSYWKSTTVAQLLLKGTVVQISGRLFTSAYVSSEGEAKANLNALCNSIKVHSKAGKKNDTGEPEKESAAVLVVHGIKTNAASPDEDDIPF